MFCNTVRGRAQQVIAEEVTCMTEHDQVGVSLSRHADDQLRGVAGTEVDLEPYARLVGLHLNAR
jgi:hypothetical protein